MKLQSQQVFDRTKFWEGFCDSCFAETKVVAFFSHWDDDLKFPMCLCSTCLFEGLKRLKLGNDKTSKELFEEEQAEERQGITRLAQYKFQGDILESSFPINLLISHWEFPGNWKVIEAEKAELKVLSIYRIVNLEISRQEATFLDATFTSAQAKRLLTRCYQQIKAGDKNLSFGVICPRCFGFNFFVYPLWDGDLKLALDPYDKPQTRYTFSVSPQFLAKLAAVIKEANG